MSRPGKKRGKDRGLNWEIEPWSSFAFHRNPGPDDFRVMRKCLRLSQSQCAEFLGVHRSTVLFWETGRLPVQPMAYHVLRLLTESRYFTITHKAWEGWQVRGDGRLYAPGGRYHFEARELGAWWIRSQQVRTLEENLATTREALSAAEAENTELRTMFVNQGLVAEIADMQDRLATLVSRLHTAKVIPLPVEGKKRSGT